MRKKYPFDELKVGDAFDVPFGAVTYGSLRSYVSRQARQLGVELSVRAVPEEHLWEVSRVAPFEGKTYARRGVVIPVMTRREREDLISHIRRKLDEM